MTRTVIVLSYRPGDWLSGCLDSVTGQAEQVVLVDNASPDWSASAIGHRAGAEVVRAPVNLGFAGGVNLGLRRARGDVVALLNDDAEARPGWLDSAERLLANPDVAAVTPRILRSGWYRQVEGSEAGRRLHSVEVAGRPCLAELLGWGVGPLEVDPVDGRTERRVAEGRPFYVPILDDGGTPEIVIDGEPNGSGITCRLLNKAGGYLFPDGVLGDYGDETPDDSRWDQPAERFFGSGTALVMRLDTVRRIGSLAEPFFAYYEDGDWSWRARLAGLSIVYDPHAVVEHRHSATSGGAPNPLVRRLAERNRLLCLLRNAPAPVARRALTRATRDATEQGRRSLLRLAPWALASRRILARQWRCRPEEVWDRWAGADVDWDRSPLRAA